MKSVLPIPISTPTLNENTFHIGGKVEGTNPNAGMFCYNFKHWCFTRNLNKRALNTFKSLVNDLLIIKLDQLMSDSEIWQIEGTWMGQLNHRYHILVVKNLQKALNLDEWHMESDLFMEDALYQILEDSFILSGDNADNMCGDERKRWVSVFKTLGYKEKELFEMEGTPEEMWWDLDFEMLKPNNKAVKDYCNFLREKY